MSRTGENKRLSPKWALGALIAAVICGTAVYQFTGCINDPMSMHKGPPSEGIVCLTEQNQYPIGTEHVTIRVENRGDYRGEINKPYLEAERRDGWHVLHKSLQVNEPANLLFVMPGESVEWDIYLGGYDLSPGQYRAMFDYCQEDGYFAFPFELAATK